jgi:RNA polymerase sigma-70 factor (ECF subfamily)
MLRYIKSKIADPELAEDILQESLLKALSSAPELRDDQKIIPWFYRIVNNAITDLYRHRGVVAKYMGPIPDGAEPGIEPEERATICACMRDLIPTLKPEYAELIEGLDLNEEDNEAVAERIGITRNNLKVRHHRARTQLRQRLEETCRSCATHGCLDCSCKRG